MEVCHMQYKPFKELHLSTLGMGNMRLPTIEGDRNAIDETKAREIIEYAYHNGVNYFDTAYRYHGGASEPFVGKVLNQFPRDTWYLASKMPGHQMYIDENGKLAFTGYLAGLDANIPHIFEDQLQRCGVEYFDFYLLHNVCETSYDLYTNEDLGIVRYLLEQKKAGRIRHLGFSAHGRADTIEKFLNKYDCFEFCQIQLNYMDWQLQDAKAKYEVLEKHNIPVIVMEPVRGGELCNLPDDAAAMLDAAAPGSTQASWAFRYLHSLPNVQVVLSGMTTLEQLKENIDLFSVHNPTTDEEKQVLDKVIASMVNRVPCTACRYCCDVCPQGLDIPKLISLYNEANYKKANTMVFTLGAMKEDELPGACLQCGACAAVCPQNINIPDMLEKAAPLLK